MRDCKHDLLMVSVSKGGASFNLALNLYPYLLALLISKYNQYIISVPRYFWYLVMNVTPEGKQSKLIGWMA